MIATSRGDGLHGLAAAENKYFADPCKRAQKTLREKRKIGAAIEML